MNEGIHLDLDTWIVPGQIRKANLCWGSNIQRQIRKTQKAYAPNVKHKKDAIA